MHRSTHFGYIEALERREVAWVEIISKYVKIPMLNHFDFPTTSYFCLDLRAGDVRENVNKYEMMTK